MPEKQTRIRVSRKDLSHRFVFGYLLTNNFHAITPNPRTMSSMPVHFNRSIRKAYP